MRFVTLQSRPVRIGSKRIAFDQAAARAASNSSSLFVVEWGGSASPTARSYSIAPPDPHRSLAVVPLIGDKRYYGEATVYLP